MTLLTIDKKYNSKAVEESLSEFRQYLMCEEKAQSTINKYEASRSSQCSIIRTLKKQETA